MLVGGLGLARPCTGETSPGYDVGQVRAVRGGWLWLRMAYALRKSSDGKGGSEFGCADRLKGT